LGVEIKIVSNQAFTVTLVLSFPLNSKIKTVVDHLTNTYISEAHVTKVLRSLLEPGASIRCTRQRNQVTQGNRTIHQEVLTLNVKP
jgi:flagellar biosynthesis component FlhA